MAMQYLTNGIYSLPTIGIEAAGDMESIGGKAVKYDDDGKIVLCDTLGEYALGVVTVDEDNTIEAGDTVSVQIKDNGLVYLGEDVTAYGTQLTTNASGEFVSASSGNVCRAIALGIGESGTLIPAMLVSFMVA